MSVSVQQVISDAKKLAARLKDYESTTDTMLTKAQNLNKAVESMKEVGVTPVCSIELNCDFLRTQYHEEIQQLSQLSQQQMPRSSLIVTIQRESKQLRLLENENRELRSVSCSCSRLTHGLNGFAIPKALEDHQYALELIMSKYRQQVTQLVKSNNNKQPLTPANDQLDSKVNDVIKAQSSKILEMAAVMQKAAQFDESDALRDKQVLAQLKAENQVCCCNGVVAQSRNSLLSTRVCANCSR